MAYGIFRRKALAFSGGRLPLWAAWCAAILLLAAGVGCASYAPPNFGITGVSVTDGRVIAENESLDWRAELYESYDGGFTWHRLESDEDFAPLYERIQADTPRGEYRIEDSRIVLRAGDAPPETVYDARPPRSGPDQWMQTHNARDLPGIPEPSSGPSSIAYDPGSGNVIAALGLEGVVVGTAGGQWIPAPVGLYAPPDYSNSAKIRALFSREGFWLQLVIAPLAMLNLMLGAAYVFRRKEPAANPNDDGCRGMFGLFCLLCSLGFSSLILLLLSLDAVGTENAETFSGILSIVFALPSAFLSIVLLWPGRWPMRYRAICGNLVTTALAVFLTPFIWVQTGGELSLARAISLLSCAALAILLGRNLARRMPLPPAETAEV